MEELVFEELVLLVLMGLQLMKQALKISGLSDHSGIWMVNQLQVLEIFMDSHILMNDMVV